MEEEEKYVEVRKKYLKFRKVQECPPDRHGIIYTQKVIWVEHKKERWINEMYNARFLHQRSIFW